jgi:hypothetical protein
MTGVVLRNLGGQLGFGETALSRGDDLVQAIDASGLFAGGLRVFGTLYSGAQIRVRCRRSTMPRPWWTR